ncbi:MAG: hypothetical protein WAR01_10645 [Dokdonella sp.]
MTMPGLPTAALLALATLLAACAQPAATADTAVPMAAANAHDAQQQFFDAIARRCGEAFGGRLVSTDAADADMAGQTMVMHISKCSADEIRIPFHVGDDRSRTWVLSRVAPGLRLKHDHRHADGSEDAITRYGGDTVKPGSATRQEFPADAQSIALFTANAMQVSNGNVWAVEVDDKRFAY